jgi:precorrin-2 methylase
MKLVMTNADMERSEEIAASMCEALAEIVDDGEDLANIVLGASMFWQIIYQWADHEINGGSESIH